MAKIVAKTYGDALFGAGAEKGILDTLYEEVQAVCDIFAENLELKKLLSHPQILKEEKEEVIKNIFEGRISEELIGFLLVIIRNGRQDYLDAIFSYFISRVKEYKKIGVVYVTVPMPLTEGQQEAIENKLVDTTGYESLEMHFEEDASLIGGMVIRIGDRIIDSSVKFKLNELAKELMKVQLA